MSVKSSQSLRRAIVAAVFSALIVVFTVVPYTGYITYAPLLLEITTLHIVVIVGAVLLGWKYGALLGGVWGVTCLLRALTNPLWAAFLNPLVSILPRILVGMVAGALFAALSRLRMRPVTAAAITAVVGSLTNTLLVLSALNLCSGMFDGLQAFYAIFQQVWSVILSVNGAIELGAALVLVPSLYRVLTRVTSRW